jgi:hypothetical protein
LLRGKRIACERHAQALGIQRSPLSRHILDEPAFCAVARLEQWPGVAAALRFFAAVQAQSIHVLLSAVARLASLKNGRNISGEVDCLG